MAKDYFNDDEDVSVTKRTRSSRAVPIRRASTEDETIEEDIEDMSEEDTNQHERSIRNIRIPAVKSRRPMPLPPTRARNAGFVELFQPNKMLWIVAVVCVCIAALFAFVAFRPTSVDITPRAHAIVFDQSVRFTAYPSATAPSGALAYDMQTFDFEDSEVVPTSGTKYTEEKASGTITVYNAYSAGSVRLIKNTRFETPSGLVFRTPAEVVVPGKKGSTPGKVDVTVIADSAGESYNVPAIDKWTIPGLKSNASMYANVYAVSKDPMTGGFAGNKPSFAAGAEEAALAQIRSRLGDKARAALDAASASSTIALPGLMRVTYEALPPTEEAGGAARIHQRAHVQIPVFNSKSFASLIADTVSADAATDTFHIAFSKDFVSSFSDAETILADDPFQFSMSGSGTLIWDVDVEALKQALLGRDEAAFQTIVTDFPGIQEAHARIQPFWNSRFPSESDKIRVDVQEPVEKPTS